MIIKVVRVNGMAEADRPGVCYVGRQFAGWPASPWGNPFKPGRRFGLTVEQAIESYRKLAISKPADWLAGLWAACDCGRKPLGCWCVNAEVTALPRAEPLKCHAQVLAEMLIERYGHN